MGGTTQGRSLAEGESSEVGKTGPEDEEWNFGRVMTL